MITLIGKYIDWRIVKGKAKIDFNYLKASSLRSTQVEVIKTIHASIVDIEFLAGEFFSIVKKSNDLTTFQMETILRPLVSKIFETKKNIQANSIVLDKTVHEELEKTMDVLFSYLQKTTCAMLHRSEDIYDTQGKHLGFALAEMRSLSNSDIEQYYKIMQEIEQIKTVELNRIKLLLQEKLRAFIHS